MQHKECSWALGLSYLDHGGIQCTGLFLAALDIFFSVDGCGGWSQSSQKSDEGL